MHMNLLSNFSHDLRLLQLRYQWCDFQARQLSKVHLSKENKVLKELDLEELQQ